MHMVSLLLAVVCLGLALVLAELRKAYTLVPPRELKRRAAGGNALAKKLYPAVAYGSSLLTLLWTLLTVFAALGLVLLGAHIMMVALVPAVALYLWLLFSWLPSTRLTAPMSSFAAWLTPAVVWLLRWFDPVAGRLSGWVHRHYTAHKHSRLYELDDLLDLLDLQSQQPDSRMTTDEISLLRQVLGFGELHVTDVLLPRSKVVSVSLSDPIGPVLLDELHASGQTVFPVKKAPRAKEIVGTLQLGDVGIHSVGTVEQYMTPSITEVQETDLLTDVLRQFHATKQQLFVVYDSEDAYLGIVTLEAVLGRLLPASSVPEAPNTSDVVK